MFLQLVSSVCEKLSLFLDFLVIRNILMFSTSKRKRRRLLRNDWPRYIITLLMLVAVSPLWGINIFSSVSWQWNKHWFVVNSNRHRPWNLRFLSWSNSNELGVRMHNKQKPIQIPKPDSSPQSWKVKVVSLADVKALPKLQQSLPQISQREEQPPVTTLCSAVYEWAEISLWVICTGVKFEMCAYSKEMNLQWMLEMRVTGQ